MLKKIDLYEYVIKDFPEPYKQKNVGINLQVDQQTKHIFQKICSDHNLTMTEVLNRCINLIIYEYDQRYKNESKRD